MRDVPPSRSGWRGFAHRTMKTFVCISWMPVDHVDCRQRRYQNDDMFYSATFAWRPTPTGFMYPCVIRWVLALVTGGRYKAMAFRRACSSSKSIAQPGSQARLRHTAALPKVRSEWTSLWPATCPGPKQHQSTERSAQRAMGASTRWPHGVASRFGDSTILLDLPLLPVWDMDWGDCAACKMMSRGAALTSCMVVRMGCPTRPPQRARHSKAYPRL
jgi:hypothetical protein